jgi:hypothetical protein
MMETKKQTLPAVPHDPVLLASLLICSPSGDGYGMRVMGRLGCVIVDSTSIVGKSMTIEGDTHGASGQDFRLDGLNKQVLRLVVVTIVDSILGYCGIRHDINLSAGAAVFHEGITGTTGVEFGAGGVNVGTKSFLAVVGTRQIRLTRLVWDEPGLFPDEFECFENGASMTGSGTSATVQNVLNGKSYIFALCMASNFDAILKDGNGSMSPAAPTILGDVLIEHSRQKGTILMVAPRKGRGKIAWIDVGNWKRLVVVAFHIGLVQQFGIDRGWRWCR